MKNVNISFFQVELKELTDRQELSRKEHYKRVKSLLKSQVSKPISHLKNVILSFGC